MTSRLISKERATKETSVTLVLDLDGSGQTDITTGVPFYDHMLDQLGRHGGFDLTLKVEGDIEVDTHHSIEDSAILLGQGFAEALGSKTGIRRFASGLFPLDEALIEVAVDLSGRPFLAWNVEMETAIGLGSPAFDPSMAEHVFTSFVNNAGLTLHVNKKAGRNTHHIVEAAFKGLARCLREAVKIESSDMPSTKGVL